MDSAIDSDGLLPACFLFDDLLAARIAALLLQELGWNESALNYEYLDGMADPRFDALIDYIRDHLGLTLRLTDLSIQSGLSRIQVAQAFRHHFACSPKRWIQLERAKVLNKQFLEG